MTSTLFYYKLRRNYRDIPRWNIFRNALGPSHRPLKYKNQYGNKFHLNMTHFKFLNTSIAFSNETMNISYFSICQYICGNRWAFMLYIVHLGTPWSIGNVSRGWGGTEKSNSAIIHSPGLKCMSIEDENYKNARKYLLNTLKSVLPYVLTQWQGDMTYNHHIFDFLRCLCRSSHQSNFFLKYPIQLL